MPFTDDEIQQVWEKGTRVPDNNPDVRRKDSATAWIRREKYANRDSKEGWEIHHIDPSQGDELSNLQPLQWQNNVALQKGNVAPKVISKGDENIEL